MKKIYYTARANAEGAEAAAIHLAACVRYQGSSDEAQYPKPPESPWPVFSPEGKAWQQGWNGVVVPAGFGEELER